MYQVLTSGRDVFIKYKANVALAWYSWRVMITARICVVWCGVHAHARVCACVFVCIENIYIYYIDINYSHAIFTEISNGVKRNYM